MEERGLQTLNGLIEQLVESKEALEQFLRLLNALQRSGILPLLIGIIEHIDDNMVFLAEQNAILIRNIDIIYSILSGKEKIDDINLKDLLRELNDPDVKRGLYLILKILKAIGSASKKD